MIPQQVSNVVATLCILAAWSYLIKENPVYRLAEHLLVGIATGYGVAYSLMVEVKPRILEDIIKKGNWSHIIPAIIGLLIYFSFWKGYEWIGRITMAFWIGLGAGNTLAYSPPTWLKQVFDSFIRLNNVNNVIYFIIVVTVLMYFAFTLKKDRGILYYGSKIGRYALMVGFGSAYGSITMSYLSLIVGQLQIILKDTLHLVK